MIKRLFKSALLALVFLLVLSSTALAAWQFIFPIVLADTSNTTRVYYPVVLGFNGQSLIDAAKIAANGTDTNMQTGSLNIKYMLSTTNVTAVVPSLPAGGLATLSFYTGYTPLQSGFPIITGSGGYVTVSDNESLEFGSNSTLTINGYINTDSGAGKNLYNKPSDGVNGGARLYVSETVSGNITFDIFSLLVSSNTSPSSANGSWSNPGDAIDGNTGTLADAPAGATAWTDNLTLDIPDNRDIVTIRTYISTASWNAGNKVAIDLEVGGSWSDNVINTVATNSAYQTHTINVNDVDQYRMRIYNAAGSPYQCYIYETDYIYTYDSVNATVTATGVSSANHTVSSTLHPNSDVWATGSVLHIPNTLDDGIIAGTDYNSAGQFWISIWIKLDEAYPDGSYHILFEKYKDSGNYIRVHLHQNGSVYLYRHNAVAIYTLTQAVNWTANTWHHILASTDNISNAQRLIVDGGTPVTANVSGSLLPSSGTVRLGSSASISGLEGEFQNIVTGTDALTAQEEADLYAGKVPSDAVNYWFFDEGTGTSILSYGTLATTGTADVNTSWETATYTGSSKTGRLTSFALIVGNAGNGTNNTFKNSISVPDNTSNITLFQNNVMPYANNITLSVNGTQQLWFAPNVMLIGATIPDRAGSVQNGTITWGSNANVDISYGAMTSYESYIASGGVVGGFDMPQADMPSTWYNPPGGVSTTLPFYDSFSSVAAQLGKPVQVLYSYLIIGLAMGSFLGIVTFTRSALLAYIAMVMVFGIGASMTIIPAWIVFVLVIVGAGIMYLYRQVAY